MSNDTEQQTTRGLPPELTEGLTVHVPRTRSHTAQLGAQIRREATHVDHETMQTGSEETFLYVSPGAAPAYEGGSLVHRFDATAARALRDLLNIATARGYL